MLVRDTLPASFHYAPGTARVEMNSAPARSIEPEINGSTLTFNLGSLAAGARAALSYRTRIGVNARAGESWNSAIVEGALTLGERVTSAPARAAVVVGKGIFSTRQIVLGRVFADKNGNGLFDEGEPGVAGVRLYLPNGQSVITDANGMYNLPAVDDGSVVIALDPVTLPAGFKLNDADTRDGRSWTRLLRTPLGGGGLLRQNFALRPPVKQSGDAKINAATDNGGAPAQTNGNLVQPLTNQTPTTAAAHTERTSYNANDNAARTLNDANAQPSDPVAPKSNAPANDAPLAPGTYEMTAKEPVAPVAPGTVLLVAPATEEVIKTPALTVEARVAEGWRVAVEIEHARASDTNVGERRVDHQSKTTTYSFVGLNLRPGPNRLRVTPISPEGVAGQAVEQIVYGRGPAVRLEIVTDKKELQANGRDETTVRVRAFDAWHHPAADAPISIAVSAGQLVSLQAPRAVANADQADERKLNVAANNVPNLNEQQTGRARQQFVSLAGGEAVVKLVADNTAGAADLHASAGTVEAEGEIQFTPELRPTLLVGLAEVTVGRAAPENDLRGTDETVRSHVEFFYRGRVFGQNLLTLAYDSQRPINRTAGRDRLFNLDPLERAYQLFGDTSTRFE
ncbi:MAG TPA: SdrD B-like domain-containing protein, partial [Pyrinomonadaceae bacterium]|nr:SdrD B-like domain-containing protein [Pyrinomonadaceae bacterium]